MLLIILTGRALNSSEKSFLIECEMIWSRVCRRSISSSLQQIKLYSFSHLHFQLGFLACRVATWPTFRSPKPSKRDEPRNDDFQMSPFLTNRLSSRIRQISPSAGRTLNVILESAVPSLMRAAAQPTCSPDPLIAHAISSLYDPMSVSHDDGVSIVVRGPFGLSQILRRRIIKQVYIQLLLIYTFKKKEKTSKL